MKRTRRNLSTNNILTTKINPTPTSVPKPLTNQVKELGNINQQTRQQPPQQEFREYQKVPQKRNLTGKTGKSACYNSGATVHAMKPEYDYIPTNIPSDKVFGITDEKIYMDQQNISYVMKYRIQKEQQM